MGLFDSNHGNQNADENAKVFFLQCLMSQNNSDGFVQIIHSKSYCFVQKIYPTLIGRVIEVLRHYIFKVKFVANIVIALSVSMHIHLSYFKCSLDHISISKRA